jgi:hypothetical protein
MSTTVSFPNDFLAVFGIGSIICAPTWFFARHRIERSWKWRAFICLLIGVSIAPTFFQNVVSNDGNAGSFRAGSFPNRWERGFWSNVPVWDSSNTACGQCDILSLVSCQVPKAQEAANAGE